MSKETLRPTRLAGKVLNFGLETGITKPFQHPLSATDRLTGLVRIAEGVIQPGHFKRPAKP